jgi:hypothetical protein
MIVAERPFRFKLECIPLLLLTGLFMYMTWRSYKRPTALLNGFAIAIIAFALGSRLVELEAANMPNAGNDVARTCIMPFMVLVAAVGGLRGSIAMRRFGNNPQVESPNSVTSAERQLEK